MYLFQNQTNLSFMYTKYYLYYVDADSSFSHSQMRNRANAICNYITRQNFHMKVSSYSTEQESGSEAPNM